MVKKSDASATDSPSRNPVGRPPKSSAVKPPVYPPSPIGMRAREIRESMGMTRKELASKLTPLLGEPVHPNTIYKLENGRLKFHEKRINAFSAALDIPVNELMNAVPTSLHSAQVSASGDDRLHYCVISPEGFLTFKARLIRALVEKEPNGALRSGEKYVITLDGANVVRVYATNPERWQPLAPGPDVYYPKKVVEVVGKLNRVTVDF